MNYRHVFHAGNFADLVKHAALTELLARLTKGAPLTVIDTHAGRGLYDLAGPEARASRESDAGIVRLMQAREAPGEFARLVAATTALNPPGDVRRYPGSPWLIAEALRPADRYVACELRREEHVALRKTLEGRRNVQALCADGFAAATEHCPRSGPVLVLIDPPFESPDDYARAAETLARVRRRNQEAVVLVWAPLKDLETFDGFLRDAEDLAPGSLLVTEVRLRPLTDPMKMNGCAVLLSPPHDMESPLAAIAGWVAQDLGEGGASRVRRLPSS